MVTISLEDLHKSQLIMQKLKAENEVLRKSLNKLKK